MSTVDRPERRVFPPLEAGQRLDQRSFHERYEAMPSGTRAELIGGVVYMPSPLRTDHGELSRMVSGWLLFYQRFTKGLRGADNVSLILGDAGEPQPDGVLFIPEDLGGLSSIDAEGYIAGPCELIVEVARSSRVIDLGSKKRDYERSGVPEYVVIAMEPDGVQWFVLREGRYVAHSPSPDGCFRSDVFPGLWLDPAGLFAGDLDALYTALEQGMATREHTEFVAQLSRAERAP